MACRRGGPFGRHRGDWWRARRAEQPIGNSAFDEYREETLRRLEEEQSEFRDFLERLRRAKDKAEFDQFMAERRRRPPEVDPGNGLGGGPIPEPQG